MPVFNLESPNFPRTSTPTCSAVTPVMTSSATSGRCISKFEKNGRNTASDGIWSNVNGAAFCLPHQLVGFLLRFIATIGSVGTYMESWYCDCQPHSGAGGAAYRIRLHQSYSHHSSGDQAVRRPLISHIIINPAATRGSLNYSFVNVDGLIRLPVLLSIVTFRQTIQTFGCNLKRCD